MTAESHAAGRNTPQQGSDTGNAADRRTGPRIGSLFSGAGGLDMAVEAVFGGHTVWHSEIDPAASKVLAHRYPGVPNLGDISGIDWSTVEPVDILCGGFPCTDVSAAGKRAGMHGTRSGLWSHMVEAIDVLRPPIVVIENVRGLLNADANRPVESDQDGVGNGSDRPVLRAIGAVLGDLADIGTYEARWVTVAAGDVGAPHRRERVFIVATHTHTHTHVADPSSYGWDEGRPESARLVGGSDVAVSRDGDVALLPTPTTQDGANNGGPSQFQRNTLPLNAEVMLLPTPSTHDKTGARSPESIARMEKPFSNLNDTVVNDLLNDGIHTLNLADAIEVTHGRDVLRCHHPADARLICDSAISCGVCSCVLSVEDAERSYGTQWGKYAPAIARWEAIVGPAPAPTEPNKNGNPRLSAAFSEWLMGWPAGWVTDPAIGISRNDQLRIVGNGVCPQQAIAALRFLLSVAAGTTIPSARTASDVTALLPTPRAQEPGRTNDGYGNGLAETVERLLPELHGGATG